MAKSTILLRTLFVTRYEVSDKIHTDVFMTFVCNTQDHNFTRVGSAQLAHLTRSIQNIPSDEKI